MCFRLRVADGSATFGLRPEVNALHRRGRQRGLVPRRRAPAVGARVPVAHPLRQDHRPERHGHDPGHRPRRQRAGDDAVARGPAAFGCTQGYRGPGGRARVAERRSGPRAQLERGRVMSRTARQRPCTARQIDDVSAQRPRSPAGSRARNANSRSPCGDRGSRVVATTLGVPAPWPISFFMRRLRARGSSPPPPEERSRAASRPNIRPHRGFAAVSTLEMAVEAAPLRYEYVSMSLIRSFQATLWSPSLPSGARTCRRKATLRRSVSCTDRLARARFVNWHRFAVAVR